MKKTNNQIKPNKTAKIQTGKFTKEGIQMVNKHIKIYLNCSNQRIANVKQGVIFLLI